ncbi:MAG: sigma 54-interacting transcriptional regulator [Desulfopila sp.]
MTEARDGAAVVERLQQQLEEMRTKCNRLAQRLEESDDRYLRMLSNLKEEFLFYRHDTQGRFTYISPSYNDILGFAPEEYMGLKSSELWTPNPINTNAERSTQLSCQGIKQPAYELEIYHKSGAIRRFITIETPIFDEEGRVIAVEGTARDITEKRKVEEQLDKYRMMLEDLVAQRTKELEVSRKQLADIINFLPYPIWVVDTNERVITWNRAMVELTGIATESVVGERYQGWLDQLYDPEEPDLVRLVLDGLYQAGKQAKDNVERLAARHNIRFEGKKVLAERTAAALRDGMGADLWITAGPILDHDETIIGAIESIRDVTLIKEAERRLVRSERRLSTLMSNLPGMAYRASLTASGWQIDFVSEGCQQIFGYEPEFFINRALHELKALIHSDDLRRVQDKVTAAVRAGASFECEYRIVTATNQTKWVFDKAEVLTKNIDDRISVEGFMADFTLFKKKEERLLTENLLLRSTIRDHYKFNKIVGNCQAMQDVYELIVKAATSEDNVFIYGESGTGKELVAQAIHEVSERKNKRFVAVNCAAIPESLIESEFFGTAKGAYTGAHVDKAGYLETADSGTLFLDEIGDISPNLQVKLLRAIDGGGFSPVGSRRTIFPDLRIVAASNRDLRELVAKGSIRQDFFFRIHVIPIHLPPLRERGTDLLLLINHFLKLYGVDQGIETLSPHEIEILKRHRWPGNVRELQNTLRRFLTMHNLKFMEQPSILPKVEEVPVNPVTGVGDQDLRGTVMDVEKQVILKALERVRWNRTKAAAELGVSRKTLFRKMKICGIS